MCIVYQKLLLSELGMIYFGEGRAMFMILLLQNSEKTNNTVFSLGNGRAFVLNDLVFNSRCFEHE